MSQYRRHGSNRATSSFLLMQGDGMPSWEKNRGRTKKKTKPSFEQVMSGRILHARERVVGAIQRRFKNSVEIFGAKPSVDKLVKALVRWIYNNDRKLGHTVQEKAAAVRAAILQMLDRHELKVVTFDRSSRYVLMS